MAGQEEAVSRAEADGLDAVSISLDGEAVSFNVIIC